MWQVEHPRVICFFADLLQFRAANQNLTVIWQTLRQNIRKRGFARTVRADDGDPLDVGFNVTYLLDGLNAVNTDEITLSLGDANSSMLLTSEGEPGFKYVVMPMRI